MPISDFLPAHYEAPEAPSAYFKVSSGSKNATKIRVLSPVKVGRVDRDKSGDKPKPIRSREQKTPLNPGDKDNQPRHFWALLIWNYSTEKCQIWEIVQSSVINELMKYISDEDRGDPRDYDLKIYKEGEKKATKYFITPSNKKKPAEAITIAHDALYYDLDALYEGKDPFEMPI